MEHVPRQKYPPVRVGQYQGSIGRLRSYGLQCAAVARTMPVTVVCMIQATGRQERRVSARAVALIGGQSIERWHGSEVGQVGHPEGSGHHDGSSEAEDATCGRIVHVGGGGRKHSQDTVTRIPCPVRKRQRERIRQGKRIRPDSGKLGCTGESHRLGGCNDVSSHVIVVVAPGMICAARGWLGQPKPSSDGTVSSSAAHCKRWSTYSPE